VTAGSSSDDSLLGVKTGLIFFQCRIAAVLTRPGDFPS